jgi:membrane protease YdiL (CAAX protease family)
MRWPVRALVWSAYLVVSLVLLVFVAGPLYPLVVGGGALLLALATVPKPFAWSPSFRDMSVLGGLYVACVALFFVAFQVVTVGSEMALFVVFGAGLLLGVVGPLIHVVVIQRRPMADLGLTRARLPETLALGVVLAAVQAAITLPLVTFGTPDTWLPLLVLALTVGLFEAIFFRGYLLAVLEPMIGVVPAVAAAALLYAMYHVGYGMGTEEMVFLGGLGIVYTVAYALTRNILVLWPLLTPLGSFFANVKGGEIEMPMVAILGFLDVIGLMVVAIYLTWRWTKRHPSTAAVRPSLAH